MIGLLGGFAVTLAGDKGFWKTKAHTLFRDEFEVSFNSSFYVEIQVSFGDDNVPKLHTTTLITRRAMELMFII